MYDGLSPDRAIFSGNSLSNKKLYLVYDSDSEHFNVITNLKMQWPRCVMRDKLYDFAHKCDKACSLCTAIPRCSKDQSSIVVHV